MIGQVIGNYKILGKLGEGGMGEVFKGVDMMLEREVAIKSLRPELTRQEDIVERFRKEAIILAKLNHPNVATLYSFFVQEERFYMVMEYAQGESLSKVIARQVGGMAWRRAIMLVMQALNALDHAHYLGIIHRDIKPSNIMLSDKDVIKVMDFGIARMVGAAHLTRTGFLVGTPAYMAPEQIRGKNIDARTDIYALGIVLYEILVGRKPFDRDSEYDLLKAQVEDIPPPLRTLSPRIPASVEDVVMRALAKNPEHRFQSAREFRFALEQTLFDKTETRRATPLPEGDDPERTVVSFYPEFDTSARLAEEAEKLRREEEEEARLKAEEEEKRLREEEAARLKAEAEEQRRREEEAARLKAEAEAEEQRRREEEAARLKAEAEAEEQRRREEEEARLKAEAEEKRRRKEEEARLKAEEEEKRRREEEAARRKAEEEEQRRREEEAARIKAEAEEQRRREEEEARLKAEAEEQRRREEEEARLKAEAEEQRRREEEARLKAEAEEKRRREEEEARRKAEEEEKCRREEEAARLKAEAEEQLRREAEEARRKAEEEEKRRREAEEARRKAEAEEQRRREAEEARRKAEEKEKRRLEEETRRKAQEEEKRRLKEEARRKAEEEEKRHREEEARRKAEKEEKRRRESEDATKVERRIPESSERLPDMDSVPSSPDSLDQTQVIHANPLAVTPAVKAGEAIVAPPVARPTASSNRRTFIAVAAVLVSIGVIAGLYALTQSDQWLSSSTSEKPQQQSEIAALLDRARAGLSTGRLDTPADDNAVLYARQILRSAPQQPEARQILQQVIARHVDLGNTALGQGQLQEATRHHEAAENLSKEFSLDRSPVQPLAERIQAELARKAEEVLQQQRQADAERNAAEIEARRKAEAEAKQSAEAERKAAETARKAAEADTRRKAEAKQRAEAERRSAETDRKAAEAEARRKADGEARQRAEAERRAAEAARKAAETEARQKADAEARQRADAERRAAEAERKAAEAEARRKAAETQPPKPERRAPSREEGTAPIMVAP